MQIEYLCQLMKKDERKSFPANGSDCNGLLGRLGAVLCSLLVGDDCYAAGQDDLYIMPTWSLYAYLIIVADAADAVSVNFSGRCKFLQI